MQQGPLAKLFGWLLLVAALGAYALVHYHAFTNPAGGRTRGVLADVPPQYILIFLDVVIFGGLFLMFRLARKHERAMREAGFEPREVAETYWEAYFQRSKADAIRNGVDFRDAMARDFTKRVVGLDSARTLSPAEIRAAVRQAAPLPATSPPAPLLGTWTSAASVRPGWTAQVELREVGGNSVARLWTWAPAGVRDEGESAASVREGFVEVKRESGGETRVVRLAQGSTPESAALDEYRFPSGKPRNMQVNSCILRRVRS